MRVLYVSKAALVAAHRDKLAWLARRVDLDVVVPDRWGGNGLEEGASTDVRITALPVVMSGHNHLHVYRGLAGAVDRSAADIVHMDEEPYSAVTLQGARAAGRRGVPYVFFAWQNIAKRLPPPFGWLRGRVFATAAGGIAGSESAASVLQEAGFGGPMVVIPQMGVDPGRFKPDPAARERVRTRLAIGPDSPVAGFVGRLLPEKGVDLLVDAARAVSGLHVLVVGDGPHRGALRERAADIGDRVHFVGGVHSFDVPEWLAAADMLVLPSRTARGWKEQFGRVLVEAMACGLPVIGSDSGEIPTVIGDAGIVCPEGDAGALAKAIATLTADPARRQELGCRGLRRVEGLYTQARVVDQTVEFYQRVLEGVGP